MLIEPIQFLLARVVIYWIADNSDNQVPSAAPSLIRLIMLLVRLLIRLIRLRVNLHNQILLPNRNYRPPINCDLYWPLASEEQKKRLLIFLFQWDSNDLSKSKSNFRLGRDIRANDISVSDKSSGQFTVSTSSGFVHLFDVRQASASTSSSPSPSTPLLTMPHVGDVLTHDVSKFDANVLVTGGASRSILCWDLRNCRRPVDVLNGHSHPVKTIVTSFHRPEEFCSTSFDFSVR